MAKVYILLNVVTGAEEKVMEDIKLIQNVRMAHNVYGVYDIIARVEADTMEEIKNIISWKIRRLDDVRSTITMIAV